MKRKRQTTETQQKKKQKLIRFLKYPKYELKYFDSAKIQTIGTTGLPLGETGGVALQTLCNIAEGNGLSERNGRRVTIKSIQIKGTAEKKVGNPHDNMMLCLVLDRQCNKANATYDSVYEASDYFAFPNVSNQKRFKILKNWYIDINAHSSVELSTVSVPDPEAVSFECYLKNLNIEINYDDSLSTGVVSTITSNNLFLMGVSSNSSTSEIKLNCRLRYTDI